MGQIPNFQCIKFSFSLWFTKDFFVFQSEPLKGKVERILHWRYVTLPVEGEIIYFSWLYDFGHSSRAVFKMTVESTVIIITPLHLLCLVTGLKSSASFSNNQK